MGSFVDAIASRKGIFIINTIKGLLRLSLSHGMIQKKVVFFSFLCSSE